MSASVHSPPRPARRHRETPAAAASPRAQFAELAARLERDLDDLCATVVERCRERFADLASDALACRRLTALTQAALRLHLGALRQGAPPDRLPELDASALAGLCEDVELELALGAYRFAQMILWQAWFALLEDSPALSARRRHLLLTEGSEFFFAYAELLCADAIAVHRRGLLRAPPAAPRRRLAVEALLAGERPTTGLDYDLERHHLALIASGPRAEAAVAALAERLGRPHLCLPSPGAGVCWAWLSATRPLTPSQRRALGGFSPRPAAIAVGLEAFGEAGFRASHRQARRALRLADPDAPALLLYEDVAIEALASENEDDARAFVAHELAGIEDDSPTSARLRQTLAAYFAAEHNAASAAATLGVHQQTVANRLRAAEERLGLDSIAARRAELELALRLRSRLSPAA